MKRIFLLLLLMTNLSVCMAQSDCFTIVGTTITGTTEKAKTQINTYQELTIPSAVTLVYYHAFSSLAPYISKGWTLVIDGGNPLFEKYQDGQNALADVNGTLEAITFKGSDMTEENLNTLLSGCDNSGTLTRIDIEKTDLALSGSYTLPNASGVRVVLPAARVGTQTFGSGENFADVYGRFTLNKAVGTFCTNATFFDSDEGSQFLFYVATGINDNRIHMQRVRYVKAGEGIVMHYLRETSNSVTLPRVSDSDISVTDNGLYAANMLKGVTASTPITETEGDMTNFILKNGAFHPTNAGILAANRAYLQIPTSTWEAISGSGANIMMNFEEETTGVSSMHNSECIMHNWYDLQGRKVHSPLTSHQSPLKKGLYVVNGKLRIVN